MIPLPSLALMVEGNVERPCFTCAHRRRYQPFIGMRCLHPLMRSTDVLLGLPPTCEQARALTNLCGPSGDLHSMAPSGTVVLS